MWKDFFKAIETLFVDYLYYPLDVFRFMDNWWAANTINWILFLIGFVAMIYWIRQLQLFNQTEPEDKEVSAHSYL